MRTEPANGLTRRLRTLLDVEASGTLVLLAATVSALVWVNLPFGDTYEQVWTSVLEVRLGEASVRLDLRHWVNDGLMAIFFFVVGMELARELRLGEMRDRRKAAAPALAALGGLTVPALIYLSVTVGSEGVAGFGIVMATDTAFALGLLAVLGPRCPAPLRRFMLTLAVIDDVGAILVIAVVYTGSLAWAPLATAAGLLALVPVLHRLGVWQAPPYALIAVAIWVATVHTGIHPTVVGIVLGVLVQVSTPPGAHPERARDLVLHFSQDPTPRRGRQAALGVRAAVSPNERLALLLGPWTSYLIVPLFALANAGIPLGPDVLARAATSPISVGIVVALVLGKPIGVLLGSWVALRSRVGVLPGNLVWGQLTGGAAVAGIGFTISLFIAELAFAEEALRTDAKVGILAGSLLAGGLGWVIFRLAWNHGGQCAPSSADDPDNLPGRLTEPVSETDHVRGPDDALVTVVEYADFECPYCGRAYPILHELAGRYRDRLRFVYRHYPVGEVHPRAWPAALAAEAAAAHGRFWEMHDRLFEDQDALGDEDLRRHGEAVGVVGEKVTGHRVERHRVRVQADVQSGRNSGVRGTPTIFVNDERYDGPLSLEALVRRIEAALTEAESAA